MLEVWTRDKVSVAIDESIECYSACVYLARDRGSASRENFGGTMSRVHVGLEASRRWDQTSRQGQAKVRELPLEVIADKNVRRLNISMQDTSVVSVL